MDCLKFIFGNGTQGIEPHPRLLPRGLLGHRVSGLQPLGAITAFRHGGRPRIWPENVALRSPIPSPMQGHETLYLSGGRNVSHGARKPQRAGPKPHPQECYLRSLVRAAISRFSQLREQRQATRQRLHGSLRSSQRQDPSDLHPHLEQRLQAIRPSQTV